MDIGYKQKKGLFTTPFLYRRDTYFLCYIYKDSLLFNSFNTRFNINNNMFNLTGTFEFIKHYYFTAYLVRSKRSNIKL